MNVKPSALSVLLISISLGLMAGCTPAASAPTAAPSPTPGPVIFQYIGHSCTLITASDGTRIISDPYGASRPVGLPPFPDDITADAVTVSHFHPDHANIKGVEGEPQVILEPGSFQVGMVTVAGYESDHGLVSGAPAGMNTVFVFEIGGVKIVHLGAAGVVTQPDILAAIESADVIVVDAHGDAEHPLDEQIAQMREVNARTIIPTHYSIKGNPRYYRAATVEEFLNMLPPEVVVVRGGSEIQVTANMPKQVIVLVPLTLVEGGE